MPPKGKSSKSSKEGKDAKPLDPKATDKKKKSSKRKESYGIYIYKVLKHSRFTLTPASPPSPCPS